MTLETWTAEEEPGAEEEEQPAPKRRGAGRKRQFEAGGAGAGASRPSEAARSWGQSLTHRLWRRKQLRSLEEQKALRQGRSAPGARGWTTTPLADPR